MTHLFTPESYDLAGTPKLNGRKATTVKLHFGGFELDHTDALHMHLAGKLDLGQPILLVLHAVPVRRDWDENAGDEGSTVTCTYRVSIDDVTAAQETNPA